MKMLKKAAALLLTLTMLGTLAACGGTPAANQAGAANNGTQSDAPKSKIDEIKEAGVLVLGTSADCPANEFHTMIDGKDTIVGFDISLGQYIADDLGVELKVVDMAFDNLCISLSKGDFDIVIAGMSATDERKLSVDFSDPYFTQPQAILVRTEDADLYNVPEDLGGHKVGVQNGSIQVPIANQYAGEESVVGLVKTQDIIMELKGHKLDVAYIDYSPSLVYDAANDDIVLKDIGLVSPSKGQCIGVQKGNEDFVEYLNTVIAKVKEDGTMDQYILDAQKLAGLE